MSVAYAKERIIHPSRVFGGYVTDTYSGNKTSFLDWTPHDMEKLDFSMSHSYPYRSGGPFLVRKCELEVQDTGDIREQWYSQIWEGSHLPNPLPLQSTMLALPSIPVTTMDNMGTKGYDKFKPGALEMNAGQFLGELKDFKSMVTPFKHGPPSNPQQAVEWFKRNARSAKSYGKGYLSYEFGWRPFLNDLSNFILSTQNLEKRLKQLKRDNGQNVRRSGTIKAESSSTSSTVRTHGHFWPSVGPFWSDGGFGDYTTATKTFTRYWFSGSFKYYVPDLPSSPTDFSNLRRMYGLTPSPSLVWELTPWSWLADYWGNVGSVMSNISGNAADSLVSTYAFVMGTEETVTKVSSSFRGNSGKNYQCSYTLTQSVKRRHPASPYGFGVDMSGLSTKQVAILSALGLSRS